MSEDNGSSHNEAQIYMYSLGEQLIKSVNTSYI